MITALRYAIAFSAAVPVAILAHQTGLEPAHAATTGVLLPATHASVELVTSGPDLRLRFIAAQTCFHTVTIVTLGLLLTSLLERS